MECGWRQQRVWGSTRHILIGIGLACVTGVGSAMAAMNPSQSAYETYATQKVIGLLDRNVCAEAPQSFNLQKDCKSLLTTNRSQIKDFIAKNTYHQNFIFFSLYTTDVSIASFLPSYRVETVGAFQHFHIYEAVED